MPDWTKEQREAIEKEGDNIIVSAGAGSGKTAVLSERALRKVLEGVPVDSLLILTFTKAAAYEMMIRIREKIRDNGKKDELEKIDRAYITTFDSFALAIVKKYHAILNIRKEVSIIDENVLTSIKKKMLDAIFEEFYQKQDKKFDHFISDFCVKEDTEVKNAILKINDKLDMKYDKKDYLSRYSHRFDEEEINRLIAEFETYLQRKRDQIFPELAKIELEVDGDYYAKLSDSLQALLEAKTYQEFREHAQNSMPSLPRGSSETVKKAKERIGEIIKEIDEKTIEEKKEDIKETILSTRDYIEAILEIIEELDRRMEAYKQEHDVYEFVDISKLAIRVVKENESIREELKHTFSEIMIDEYQDTSDLQEELIRLIENKNVYMVGDVKQSIYRFRNANPYIFKEKYDRYALNEGGYKIDLVKNFRSRKEVLEDINHIFDFIMDDHFGGANYSISHRMVFGNEAYQEKGKTTENHHAEIYNYTYPKESEFTRPEIEAFIVASDIKKKMESHYPIFDKDKKVLRDAQYSDFVILMDRGTKFDLYKKIFEYEKIPLTILKEENIKDQIEIYLVKNLITLLLKAEKEEWDEEFCYAFLSIGRSYLFEMTDQELFLIMTKKTYRETDLYRHIQNLLPFLNTLDIENLLSKMIDEFGFYKKLIRTGNVELATNNLEYIITSAATLKKIGYSIEDLKEYLIEIIGSEEPIKIPANKEGNDSVKIMTIHKSKGLEYPVCYFTGLYEKFNVKELKEKILFDDTYGIMTPYFKEGYGEIINKTLYKEKYEREEISEKIRLFYVALTRSREKMILLADLEEESSSVSDGKVDDSRRLKYNSFLEFLKSIYEEISQQEVKIDLSKIPMSEDYKKRNSKNIESFLAQSENKISCEEIKIPLEEEEEENFSKRVSVLLTKENDSSMQFGIKVHEALEFIDFKNPNYEGLDSLIAKKIRAFLNQPFLKNLKEAEIYKEYEFIDEKETTKHGIIDLLLVYQDHVDIIDYKLKQISDEAYKKQLEGYRSYIREMTDKKTKIYLYSVLDETFQEL